MSKVNFEVKSKKTFDWQLRNGWGASSGHGKTQLRSNYCQDGKKKHEQLYLLVSFPSLSYFFLLFFLWSRYASESQVTWSWRVEYSYHFSIYSHIVNNFNVSSKPLTLTTHLQHYVELQDGRKQASIVKLLTVTSHLHTTWIKGFWYTKPECLGEGRWKRGIDTHQQKRNSREGVENRSREKEAKAARWG